MSDSLGLIPRNSNPFPLPPPSVEQFKTGKCVMCGDDPKVLVLKFGI
jgi:hypothetical protein